MINAENGHVEIKGTGKTLMADYACISNVLVDKLGADYLFKGLVLGVADKADGDVLGCVAGAVEIPTDTRICTLNLSMILNAIVDQHGDNAEKIIKTAADIAMIIKRDEKVDDIEQIGRQVEKLLEGVKNGMD